MFAVFITEITINDQTFLPGTIGIVVNERNTSQCYVTWKSGDIRYTKLVSYSDIVLVSFDEFITEFRDDILNFAKDK